MEPSTKILILVSLLISIIGIYLIFELEYKKQTECLQMDKFYLEDTIEELQTDLYLSIQVADSLNKELQKCQNH